MPHVEDDVEAEVSELMAELKRRREERRQAEFGREDRLRGVLGGGIPAPGAVGQLAGVDVGLIRPFETAVPSAQRSQARGGIAPSVRRVAFDEARQRLLRPAGVGSRTDEDELRRQFTQTARDRQEGLLPPSSISEGRKAEFEARRAQRSTVRAATATADEDRKNEARRSRGQPPLRRKGESRDEYLKRISGTDQPPARGQGERFPDYLNRLDRIGIEGRATLDAQQRRVEADPGRKANLEAIDKIEKELPEGMGDVLRGYAGLINPKDFVGIITRIMDDDGFTDEEKHTKALYEVDMTILRDKRDELVKRRIFLETRKIPISTKDREEIAAQDAKDIAEINRQIDALDEQMRTMTDQRFGVVPITPGEILNTFTGADEDPERGPAILSGQAPVAPHTAQAAALPTQPAAPVPGAQAPAQAPLAQQAAPNAPPGLTVAEEKQRQREYEALKPATPADVMTDDIIEAIMGHVAKFYRQAVTLDQQRQLAWQLSQDMGWSY